MKSRSFHFEVASLSDPGLVRALNEDGVTVDRESGFAMVADGMGGHRAGDVASRLALDSVVESLRSRAQLLSRNPQQWAENVIAEANTAIHTAALNQSECKGMGATLAMAIFHDRHVTIAHVGDSRVYRLRDGRLELLTRDDSLLHDQIELGLITAEDAGDSHNRHLVTQALGIGALVTGHVREENLCGGDVYLLCTDGLNDLVDEKDIEVIIDSLKTNLQLTASHLVQLANDNGGYDNITVALVRVMNEAPSIGRKGWFSRLLGRLAS
jgi:protein phosphatase